MRKIKASLDSIPLTLYVPETFLEYREGARILDKPLAVDEGILFNFSADPSQLSLENSGVSEDLTLLFFISINRQGLVAEVAQLKKNDRKVVTSIGAYGYALEVRKDFSESFKIKQGSILRLNEDL